MNEIRALLQGKGIDVPVDIDVLMIIDKDDETSCVFISGIVSQQVIDFIEFAFDATIMENPSTITLIIWEGGATFKSKTIDIAGRKVFIARTVYSW